MKRLINWWKNRNDPHLRFAEELRILADEAAEVRMHVLADTLNGIATEVALGSSQNAELHRPCEAGSVARSGSPAKRESSPPQHEVPQSPAKRGIAEVSHK